MGSRYIIRTIAIISVYFNFLTVYAQITPSICLITVDSSSSYNKIIWEKPISDSISTYNIYREIHIPDIFEHIVSVSYNDLSVFNDMLEDPKIKESCYKITYVDKNNVESEFSTRHKSIHLEAAFGIAEINLHWTLYEGFTSSFYQILRGKTMDTMQLLDTVSYNVYSYSDTNPPSGIVYYRIVAVKPDTCYPEGLQSTHTYRNSYSNIKSIGHEHYTLLVDPLIVTIDTPAGSYATVNVYTNLDTWNAESNEVWLDITKDIPNKTFTATANSSSCGRVDTIYVSGLKADTQKVTVIQGTVGVTEDDIKLKLIIFPNPYQYFTNIEYNLETASNVKIEVFNIIGVKVAEILNKKLPPGLYNHMLNTRFSEDCNSIYFLKFSIDDIAIVRKLVEIR